MNNLQSISYFYPELILTLVILGAIIYDLFIDKDFSGRVGWVVIIGLVFVSLVVLGVFLEILLEGRQYGVPRFSPF